MYLRTSVDHSKYINTSLVREWAVETVPRIDGPNDLTEDYAIVAVYSEAHAQTVTTLNDREETKQAIYDLIANICRYKDNEAMEWNAKKRMDVRNRTKLICAISQNQHRNA